MTMITINLDSETHKWCKDHSLVFSQVLRDAIARKREVVEGYIVENVQEERRKKEKAIQLRDLALSLLNEKQRTEYLNQLQEQDK